jgi:WD40 repeat protein
MNNQIISGCYSSTVFVSGDDIGTIYIGKYNNTTNKQEKLMTKIIDQIHGPIHKICCHPMKNYFFLCGDISGAIMKLTVTPFFATEIKTVATHQYQVCDMDIHKNGNFLVTCSNDAIKLWDIKMDGMIILHTIKPESYSLCVAFHPEKSFFAVGYADKKIRLFVLDQMNKITETGCSNIQSGDVNNIVFDKTGGEYLAATSYNSVYIYNFPKMDIVYCFRDNIEPVADFTRYNINDLVFINDKKMIITTCNNKQIIQRFYNDIIQTMNIEFVKNYDYSVNNIQAHETPTS